MYLFKKLPGSERGTVTLPLIEKPHLLPIPFPRGMFVSEHFRLSATGLRQTLPTTTQGATPPLEFLGTLPTLLRTSYDSQYLPTIDAALQTLKTLKPQTRAQIHKDYVMEEEELRTEVRERLERLYEGVRGLEGEEEDEGEDQSDEY